MPTFKSIVQLQKYAEEQAHKALEKVANEVLEEWKALVKKRVYEENILKADPSNNFYERTNQLLDSLELKWINPLLVELSYNTEKILPSMMLDRHSFNRHTSFSGEDWSDVIPYFIEMGNGNSRIYSYEGIHAFDDMIKMLKQSFSIRLKQALRQQGL